MPRSTPEKLSPYIAHGINLEWSDGSKEATGDCPFCSREKFSVNMDTGMFRCLVCAEGTESGGGNATTFIRKLHEYSLTATEDYTELELEYGIKYDTTLMEWGVAKSIITGRWLFPAYGAKGNLNQLYIKTPIKDRHGNWSQKLIPTATLGSHLFGMNLWNSGKNFVYMCEGIKDAISLYEAMTTTRVDEDGNEFVRTANRKLSLYANANIIATPGCGVFLPSWLSLFPGKNVVTCFDNDYPKEHPQTGNIIEPAGYKYCKKNSVTIMGSSKPANSVSYLRWGSEGYDSDLPKGFDLSDIFSDNHEMNGFGHTPQDKLSKILSMVSPAPDEWMDQVSSGNRNRSTSGAGNNNGGADNNRQGMEGEIEPIKCEDLNEIYQAFDDAEFHMTVGLKSSLISMLATCLSTVQIGDQLWMKIIGPPSCGKSTLFEAMSVASDYVYPKSTIRGFFSGATDETGQDYSLATKLNGMTLATKDGDTILQSPNFKQILSEGRDLYDTVSRTNYRTKAGGEYFVRMTWLLAGTAALREIDDSELGQRFLDCVVMTDIPDELEDMILDKIARSAFTNVKMESKGDVSTNYDPAMLKAMQITGGYVNYLRRNNTKLLGMVEARPDHLRLCNRLGKFTAFMRARPSSGNRGESSREFAGRLVSQISRLMACSTVVTNSRVPDSTVTDLVYKVAMDTSRGITLTLSDWLYKKRDGLTANQLAIFTNHEEHEINRMLKFLSEIDAVKFFRPKVAAVNGRKVKQQLRWSLTDKMVQIYEELTSHNTVPEDEVPF